MIACITGEARAQRRTDTYGATYNAESEVEASGAARDIGDNEREDDP